MRWDLSPLFGSADDARAALATSLERATAFEQAWRGAMPEMTGPRLAEALLELGDIDNLLSRVHSYASLRKAVDVTNEENRDLSAAVEQGVVQVLNALRFFELEWLVLEDDRAAQLAATPEVAADRHYLEALRRFRPHTLSEPEERVLAERDPAAVSAWQALFGQTTSTIEVPFDGGDGEEPHTVDRLLAYVHDPRRDVRRGALETLYAALGPHTPVLAQCYDSLVGDRLVLDRLRSYETPITLTHLRNELDASVVDAMLDAVEANYPIAQRWFRAKAGVLGLDKLELHDQYAPVGNARDVGYDEARTIVTTAFDGFAPRVRQVADDLFAEHRIDAEPRAGKRGGAFCSPVAGDADPYIMMNFTDHMNDVLTMAHELGHGMHFELAHAEQTPHSAHTGLALAEVPSTFAEFVTYDHLLAGETDAGTRLALVAARAEGAFATVFRQTVMVRYEQRAYEMRGHPTTLTPDRLSAVWLEENQRYYGDALALIDGYELGWSYIPHFINTRFYTYAYVFAKLVALVLYARYREDSDAFVPGYLELLSAGGSADPATLLGRCGVDITDPSVWSVAFAELDRMVEAAEAEI